jgi:hypothetical protein
MKYALIFVLAVALGILMPFVIIWAMNTLFNAGISYSFWSWLAILIMTGFLNNLFNK